MSQYVNFIVFEYWRKYIFFEINWALTDVWQGGLNLLEVNWDMIDVLPIPDSLNRTTFTGITSFSSIKLLFIFFKWQQYNRGDCGLRYTYEQQVDYPLLISSNLIIFFFMFVINTN